MRLVELEMTNFCQYHHRTVQFGPGLTAIIGPNGSGKSNMIGAVRYALSGEITNAGAKAKNIRQNSDETEQSRVRLAFVHNDRHCEVTRFLRPDREETTLTVEGERLLTGDKRVTARIMDMLGIDAQILNDIVIVGQGEMFGFLSRSPAKRAEAFQRLFHTDRAKAVCDAIGKHLSGIQIPQVDVDLAARRQELANLQAVDATQLEIIGNDHNLIPLIQEQTHLQERVSLFNSLPGLRQAAALGEQTIAAGMRSLAAAQSAVVATQTQIATTEQAIQMHEAAIAKTNADMAVIQSAKAGVATAAAEARRLLATMEQRKQLEQTRASINEQIEAAEAELRAPPPQPPQPPTIVVGQGFTSLDHEYDTVNAIYQREKQFVESFDPAKGVVECPTCHTPAANLVAKVAESRRGLSLLKASLDALAEKKLALQRHNTAMQVHNSNAATFETGLGRVRQRLATLRQQLAGLGDVPPVTEPEDVLKARVLEDDDYEAGLVELRQSLPTHQGALGPLRMQLSQLQQQLVTQQQAVTTAEAGLAEARAAATQIAQQIGSIDVSESEVLLAAPRMQWLTARITAVTTARSVLATTRETIATTQTRIAELEQAAASAERLRTYVAKMQRMRDVVHHDAAPRFVTQRNLELLTAGTNDNLSLFETDFRVAPVEGLTYRADFIDGRSQEAERLSFGQQLVLAMSFRIALNFVYADIGFLSLDEPTAFLDDHHISGFEPVLMRLREFAASHGLQCLMVTHEQRLAPLFDAVISP